MSKKNVDWEKIELDYRAGIKTLRQIADEHGITHGAINKKAKSEDWTRDLSAKIAKKAEELVSRKLVSKTVSKPEKIAEREVIDANAQAIANVRLSHRKDLARWKTIINDLSDELNELNALKDPDNLALRSKVAKELVETHSKVITLERQAYNMDQEIIVQTDPLADLIKTITHTPKTSFGVVNDDPEY